MFMGLEKYELTEAAQKLLNSPYPLELPKTETDPHFSCKPSLLQDYHAEMLLGRADGLGARWVQPKAAKSSLTKKKISD